MKRFRKILFLAEGADKAVLRRALDIAGEVGADLTIMDAVKPIAFETADPGSMNTLRDLKDLMLQRRRDELQKLHESAADKRNGVKVAIEVPQGDISIEVLKAVTEERHDLVIKTQTGKIGRIQRIFGSTDLKLLRRCPCPVWIIKPTRRRHFARILAAVDPDPFDPVSPSLNRLILDLAFSLAKMEKSELHVVHAWHLVEESALQDGQIPQRDLDKLNEEMEAAHRHQVEALLKHYPGQEHVLHLVWGRAEKVIPDLATELAIDLIIMGTVARTGITGIFIGNTAEKILSNVDCSVLTVKPTGFKPPVVS